MKVCEKVQRKGVTTYNEVADELVTEFSSGDNHISPNDAVSLFLWLGIDPELSLSAEEAQLFKLIKELLIHIYIKRIVLHFLCVFPFQHVYDQKNIRRRVYDALNVLMAMNIISKEKKEIKWIGLPTNSAQECQNLEVERQRRLERIKQKQSQLQELILQVRSCSFVL